MAKQMWFGWTMALALAALATAPALAQEPDSLAVQRLAHNKVAGAESAEALALLLHQALQRTNFDPVSPHMISKQVYDKMLLTGVLPVQEALVLYTPDEMQYDFQKGFSQVVRDGIALEVSWPDTQVKSVLTGVPASPHRVAVLPVRLTLTSPGSLPFVVQFNAARLDGRYYFLPPLFMPNKDLN
ncbi:hypothetical protein [Pontibacter actiniarum]|uniref:Uncharacterized protein n=1 Tax=Pontibacter actiniarum TaxID=323450 RepID=A0A1X9YU27_9BACT|nr:hypothetical protein [Pontibacter actiniarum]ARS36406.1 hypothetical protein CA264_13720 [Pontibacter actiniarum]